VCCGLSLRCDLSLQGGGAQSENCLKIIDAVPLAEVQLAEVQLAEMQLAEIQLA